MFIYNWVFILMDFRGNKVFGSWLTKLTNFSEQVFGPFMADAFRCNNRRWKVCLLHVPVSFKNVNSRFLGWKIMFAKHCSWKDFIKSEVMINFQMRNLLEKCIEVTHPIIRWDQYCAIVQSKQLSRVHCRRILDRLPLLYQIVMK